jgi:hypothetical protein
MSWFTAVLGAIALAVIGLDAWIRVMYTRRSGKVAEVRANFHAPVPGASVALAFLVAAGLLGVTLIPILMPGTALSTWMNEPFATAVLLACICAVATLAGWAYGIWRYLMLRRELSDAQ